MGSFPLMLSDADSPSSLEKTVATLFAPDGVLSQIEGFEERPEQAIMAQRVARALATSSHLIVEAGTGVGKSLAYLLPAALHALQSGSKAIISTHTIHLQEQLLHKDIPLVETILGTSLGALLLKGRQNYLCPRRLNHTLERSKELLPPDLLPELEKIRRWSFTTTEGSLSDLEEQPDPQLWAQICSERHLCTPRTCGNDPRCFYQQLRKKIAQAPILILNHTLLFTLLEDGHQSGFLFPNDFLIFDEAHTIPGVAIQHLGLHLSQYQLRQTLLRLYNPRNHQGTLRNYHATKGIQRVTQLLEQSQAFFQEIQLLFPSSSQKVFAPSETKRAGATKTAAEKKTFRLLAAEHGALCQNPKNYTFLEELRQLHSLLLSLQELNQQEGPQGELREAEEKIAAAHQTILSFMEARLPEHVYWVEDRSQGDHNQPSWHLHVSPIDIAASLCEKLFSKTKPLIMTSATLATEASPQKKEEEKEHVRETLLEQSHGLDFFCEHVGAGESEQLQLGSPFDYQKQMSLHLVGSIPEPRHPHYQKELIPWIERFTQESQAAAFILFTSYAMMESIAKAMTPFFRKQKWQLLVQGGELSRSKMIEAFRSGEPSILFGTDSFWTGVDIPGEALSNIIITRLPFTAPDHPFTQAQHENLQRQGLNPFSYHSLPEAILKFRQGVGRLIRNKQDRGMVAILDSRIVTKPYGKKFLAALPPLPSSQVKRY